MLPRVGGAAPAEPPPYAAARHVLRWRAVRICGVLLVLGVLTRVWLALHTPGPEKPAPLRAPFPGVEMYPHPSYAIDPQSNVTLTPDAFPAAMPEASATLVALTKAYAQGDPHRGEIPGKKMFLLQAQPPLVAPPWPARAPDLEERAWTWHPWTREQNGSRTRAEDAERPDRQPVPRDWRPAPYDQWAPPLVALSRPVRPLPRVQHAFPSPHRHSGQANDRGRDAMIAERQLLVRSAFVRAWQGYKRHAWGADEVRPVSMKPNNNFNGWGATIVDALDTLLVMDLHEEYNLARHHVYDIDFHYIGGERSAYGQHDGRVPVFETGIRYLGGLLSAYDLTGDALMLDRAEELAQLILPAFDTLTGLPVGRMRFDEPSNFTEPRGRHESVVLAEATSMLLEFTRLWQVTGNRTYFDRVQRVTDFIDRNLTAKSELGSLMTTRIYPESPTLGGKYTFGGQADSYYEYLVKEHQLLGGRLPQYARMYGAAIDDATEHLIKDVHVVPRAPALAIFTETYGPKARYEPKLEHLGCFAGAMLGLGARLLPQRTRDLNVARRITETCWWAYNATRTGLGPEEIVFYRPHDTDRFEILEGANGTRLRGEPAGNPMTGVRYGAASYYNRPETIESVFYLYRLTGDPVWQERGWQMFAAWMTHGLVASGVSALHNVHNVPASHADSMESFTLAETFKYYYLLFSPPELVSLDDFVFTTEAHPFLAPRKGRWARAGHVPPSLRTWTPPPPCDAAGDTYCGGERLLRGGLSNAQKHELHERWLHRNETKDRIPMRIQEQIASILSSQRAKAQLQAEAHVQAEAESSGTPSGTPSSTPSGTP
ncbi:mannosyl-oligosaccharide 1,2-alpha-mannosidase [Malassezia obtusa]|uniref:alpha-1,2-Mannosidase n=1 Tax=Malassezia obtusa TaxID=76774 RepID=A0AAF0IUM6_9BASI|nr:mannosyl-oligosaccharide 1,2-alpha-mannosidase [Malassezia obtusa]